MPFRTILQLEAIGDAHRDYLRAARRGMVRPDPRREIQALQLAGDQPWVAELTGLDPRTAFTRRYLVAKRDYAGANGTGSRGVQLVYLLDEGGLYEIHARLTWKRSDHYYAQIVDGQIVRIDQEEALRCLSARIASARSE